MTGAALRVGFAGTPEFAAEALAALGQELGLSSGSKP